MGKIKYYKLGLILLSLITVGLIVVAIMYFLLPGGIQQSQSARQKAVEILGSTTTKAKHQTVSSDFGFSIAYNMVTFNAEGYVQDKDSRPGYFDGQTYNNDELKTTRGYGIVKLYFKDQGGQKISDGGKDGVPRYSPVRPDFAIVANRRKDYFGDLSKPEYKGKTKLDIITEQKAANLRSTDKDDEIKDSSVKVNGIDYRLLTVKNQFAALSGQMVVRGYTYHYMTVQNDRPYWISIFDATDGTEADVAAFEAVISTIKYTVPTDGALVLQPTSPAAVLAAADAPDDTANLRSTISDDALINVVAKNQIASVRVGVIRCASIDYTVRNYKFHLDKACLLTIGSGSIVSKDGLVATNGHVVTISDKILSQYAWPQNDAEWKSYYDFLIGAGYISRADLVTLSEKAVAGNQDASRQLMSYLQLVPETGRNLNNSKNQFIIQTSDDPIRSNATFTEWQYNKTNVAATMVDSEVNQKNSSLDINSKFSDVALLKMSGDYPTVELSSLSFMKAGDEITTMGFPAIVDDGVSTVKKTTIPTVSKGYVSSKMTDAGGNVLAQMSAEIAAGNSGGPAFDTSGKQVGINTYGGSQCPNDTSSTNACFGAGVSRDAKDINDIAAKNNLTISADSSLTDLWHKGLGEFIAGKYSKAAVTFADLDSKYPNNYLVAKFLTTAKAQPKDETDTEYASIGEYAPINADDAESVSDSKTTLIVVIAVLGSLFIAVIITIVFVANRSSRRTSAILQQPLAYPPQYAQPTAYPQQTYQQPTQYPQQAAPPQAIPQQLPTYQPAPQAQVPDTQYPVNQPPAPGSDKNVQVPPPYNNNSPGGF
ncbi:MAG: trypsin-like peptidase domain-containing protein [Candidatus Saccharimonadaceae bacterium]